jgi:hypothetical protein
MDGWKPLTKSSPSSTHRGTLTAKQPVPEHFSKTSRRFRGHLTTSRNGCEKFPGLGGVTPPVYNPDVKTVEWDNKRLPVGDAGADFSANPLIIDS